MNETVTLNRLMDIAHEWMRAFDDCADCEALLLSNGHSGFNAHREFLAQFAQSESDLADHRMYFNEIRKSRAVGAPVLNGHRDECIARYYISPWIKQQQTILAKAAGFEDLKSWLATNPPFWKSDPDPLTRAMSYLSIPKGQVGVEHYRNMFEEQARIALDAESERFCKGEPGSFLLENRLKTFRDMSLECLSPLGFKLAKSRLEFYVALDLDISEEFVLRWSIGDVDPFFLINFNRATCRPSLHLRQRSFKTRIKDAGRKTRLLVIPYELVVEGVHEVYADCYDERNIKTVIRARSLIVQWLLPYIARAVNGAI